jgi:hypothetical protein
MSGYVGYSVSGTCPTGCRPCTTHGLNQASPVPVWQFHVVLVGHVPQVAAHTQRRGKSVKGSCLPMLCTVLVRHVPQGQSTMQA